MTIISINSLCCRMWHRHSRGCLHFWTDMIQSTEHWLVWWCETCIRALQLSYVSLVTLYTSLLPGKFSHKIILMNKWVMWSEINCFGALERKCSINGFWSFITTTFNKEYKNLLHIFIFWNKKIEKNTCKQNA